LRSKSLLLLLALTALPAVSPAQFNFTTNNGAITITHYYGPDAAVVVPDTITGLKVTAIGSYAFYQVSGMTSVMFGTNLTTIGTNAIFQCPNLASVTMAGSITNIGPGPFLDCLALTTISFSSPSSFYVVTNNALFNKALTSLVEFPGGVGGSFAISAMVTNVGQAFIGNSLTAIVVDPSNLFYSSTNGVLFDKSRSVLIEYPGGLIGSYTVPTNVTTIVSASFEYSAGVTNVAIGTNVTSIGAFAFYDCPALTAINVNGNNPAFASANGVLFDKNQILLIQFPSGKAGSYVVPGSVTNILNGAFGDAVGLTSVVVPNGVTNIGAEAFYDCQALASVTIGSKVGTIGFAAFYYCPALTSLVFPASVTNIGLEAFADCQGLTNVCFQGTPPTDGGSIFNFDNALTTICHVSGALNWGPTYDGITTVACASCVVPAPTLAINHSGTNVILTWSSAFALFTLQSTSNLTSSTIWSNVSPPPTVIAGQNTVTNPIVGRQKFYRLRQ
jgi:hypothetical protein